MKIFIVTMEMLCRDYEDDALMEWIFDDTIREFFICYYEQRGSV